MKRLRWTTPIMALAALLAAPAQAETLRDCRLVYAFDQSGAGAAWETANDDVMGGRSSGGFVVADGALTFSGSTNTDGGGFSSIKAGAPRRALAGVSAFRLRVRGDGRRYLFSVETGARRRLFFRVQYWSAFDTTGDEDWQEVVLPVAGFEPYFFGEPTDARALDPARIKDVGFFIYDLKDGPFRLDVQSIEACA